MQPALQYSRELRPAPIEFSFYVQPATHLQACRRRSKIHTAHFPQRSSVARAPADHTAVDLPARRAKTSQFSSRPPHLRPDERPAGPNMGGSTHRAANSSMATAGLVSRCVSHEGQCQHTQILSKQPDHMTYRLVPQTPDTRGPPPPCCAARSRMSPRTLLRASAMSATPPLTTSLWPP